MFFSTKAGIFLPQLQCQRRIPILSLNILESLVLCMPPTGHNTMPRPQWHLVYGKLAPQSWAAEGKDGFACLFVYNAKWHFRVSAIDSFTLSMCPGKKTGSQSDLFLNFHSLCCNVPVVLPHGINWGINSVVQWSQQLPRRFVERVPMCHLFQFPYYYLFCSMRSFSVCLLVSITSESILK